MSRKQLLADLLSYFSTQMSAVPEHLQPAMLEQIGKEDDWSAKDNLFHGLVWAKNRLEMLETITRGDPWEDVDYGDFTEINREIFEEYRDHTWDDLQAMILDTYQRGSDFVDQVSENILMEKKTGDERPYWRIIADNFFNHPMIHIWEVLQKANRIDKLSEIFGTHYAEMLRKLDNSETWLGTIDYNQACLSALSGKYEESLVLLENALKANPQLIEWSKSDQDLDSIRKLPKYQDLYNNIE